MSSIRQITQKIINNIRAQVIPHSQLANLVFGQQRSSLREFLLRHYGQTHTIALPEMPHTRFLKENLNSPTADGFYEQYLDNAWLDLYGSNNTREKRNAKMKTFALLYRDIEKIKDHAHQAIKKPLMLCKRPDGKHIIIHGNHRAAIAYVLGIDIRAVIVKPEKYLRRISLAPDESYGSARLNMPYQSIFLSEKELVRGRRPDILQRIQAIDPADIKGKIILELASNIGCNSLLAAQFGAKSVTGVDYSPNLITNALKLNAFFTQPCDFFVHDLHQELTQVEPADTVFCFSLLNHLKNTNAIVKTILNKTKNVLYFEGHAGTGLEDYDYLLNADNFASIDLLGHMRNGIHSKKSTRPFFRCSVN